MLTLMGRTLSLFFLALILSACSIPVTPMQPVPRTETATASLTPPTPPEPQNCGYQWAYQDLPELSSSFQASIQELQDEAQASAFAFGENCVLPDGTVAQFLPMETDFNVTLQVTDLADENALGEWIIKVMQVIESIPADQIVGPRPGRVSITFQSGTSQQVVNFYIDQYENLPAGLSNAEIYQALRAPQ
ncbi:MAG TPA: hypothetical protein VK900_07820 [Anaerolineales bacterium]|nr:hypothetical protein [Anaerolineales bacterium]